MWAVVPWQAAACPISSGAQEILPWQGARGGSACSARPPALPPHPPSQPGGLGGVGEGPVPGSQRGAGGSWPASSSLCREAAAEPPPVSVPCWDMGAPSSPGGLLCSLSEGLHTRAPACVLRVCVESNTGTGTSSLRNGHALGMRPCACVQGVRHGGRTHRGVSIPHAHSHPCVPACTHCDPECNYIPGGHAHTAFHTHPRSSVHPEIPVPCAANIHGDATPRGCVLKTKHKPIYRGPREGHLPYAQKGTKDARAYERVQLFMHVQSYSYSYMYVQTQQYMLPCHVHSAHIQRCVCRYTRPHWDLHAYSSLTEGCSSSRAPPLESHLGSHESHGGGAQRPQDSHWPTF